MTSARGALLAAGVLAALFCLPLAAGDPLPIIDRPVTDLAGVMSPGGVGRVERELAEHREKTGVQIAVLTVPSTGLLPMEEYSRKVAEAWAGGSRGRDDGVLFTLAVADRKMRFEVGYGLEPYLTDADSLRIQEGIRGALRAGDYDGAVLTAVRGIAQKTAAVEAGKPILPPSPPAFPPGAKLPWIYFGVFALGVLAAMVTSVAEELGKKGTLYWWWNGVAYLAVPALLALLFVRGSGLWWAYPLAYSTAALVGFTLAILWQDSRLGTVAAGLWLFVAMPLSLMKYGRPPTPGVPAVQATGGDVLGLLAAHLFGCFAYSLLFPLPYLIVVWVKRKREGKLSGWGEVIFSSAPRGAGRTSSWGGSFGGGSSSWRSSGSSSSRSSGSSSSRSSGSSSGSSWSGGGGRFGGGGATSSW